MACYTVSDCVLANAHTGKKYMADLLWSFVQNKNPYKVTIDTKNRIIEMYNIIAQDDPAIAIWLQYMGNDPTNFEPIDVDTSSASNKEEIFLMVCHKTANQHKLIVSSHNGWKYYKYHTPSTIKYNNVLVEVLDKDEAVIELTEQRVSIYAQDSVVATNGSSISNTEYSKG